MAPDLFLREYLQGNQPVIVTGAMEGWLALSQWHPDSLKKKFGDMEVQVYDDLFTLVNVEALSDYLDRNFGKPAGAVSTEYVRAYARFKDVDFTWADDLFSALAGDWGHPAFFPRDAFVLPRAPRGGPGVSPVHDLFPYKGLFISGQGARTRLHRDPFGTEAVLCQFHGEKQVTFYMPECADKVIADGAFVDPAAVDPVAFPDFHTLQPTYEDVLRPGEILFIPGGWFHDVRTLSDSISITWNFVHESRADAFRREVADPRNAFDRDMLAYLGDVA
jgi:hypothetical protein